MFIAGDSKGLCCGPSVLFFVTQEIQSPREASASDPRQIAMDVQRVFAAIRAIDFSNIRVSDMSKYMISLINQQHWESNLFFACRFVNSQVGKAHTNTLAAS